MTFKDHGYGRRLWWLRACWGLFISRMLSTGRGRATRLLVTTCVLLVVMIVPLGIFTWSGVSAALDARQKYQELQDELSHFTPVDLIQVTVYQSLEGRFLEAEEASSRANSRLRFLRALQWVPVLGGNIREARALIKIGYYQGRAGRNLAGAYQAAIAIPLDQLPPDLAAVEVARVLHQAAPQLNQVRQDLRYVRMLLGQLRRNETAIRYGVLVDRYLPAIQTVAYLSLTSPEVIGHTYSLSRELNALQEMASDPLGIMANPEEAGKALGNIADQAGALEAALDVVRQAGQVDEGRDADEMAAVNDVLDILGPGVTLLRHVTAGTRSLVTIAEAIETTGFLSRDFGGVAGAALAESQHELELAKKEVASLQDLLSVQGIEVESFLPSLVFANDTGVPLTSTDRVEVLLDEAISATKFLRSFLGFDRPKTYLLLGQNQKEIRASGGFIGIAVEATLNQGTLLDLVLHDSTTVDREPLTSNPTPPEGLFWYLWMGRLLFRDSNWNPHFPSAAAQVAEIYRLGQGTQVDGVITGSKELMLDMVDVFGDITVPGADGVLTRRTAEALTDGDILYPCLEGRVSLRGKRCFDEDVFFALRQRLTTQTLTSTLRREFVELIDRHLERKNVMIHVFPPADDSFLWERGWNGAIPVVDHDYLMVVDSSLPGHSTAGVQRSFEYRVSLDPNDSMKADLRLRYDNSDDPTDAICRQFAWEVYHCYWNYFRVYIPPQSTDIQMPEIPLQQGAMKLIWGYPQADSATVATNANTGPSRLTELAGYIVVEPGSVTTVPIQYRLPPEVLRPTANNTYEYRLLIQKQPGMDDDRVSLAIELPTGASAVRTSPEFNSSLGQWLLFDFILKSDTTVVVSFRIRS